MSSCNPPYLAHLNPHFPAHSHSPSGRSFTTTGSSTQIPLMAAQEPMPKRATSRWVNTSRPNGGAAIRPKAGPFRTGQGHSPLLLPHLDPKNTLQLYWEQKTSSTLKETDTNAGSHVIDTALESGGPDRLDQGTWSVPGGRAWG